MNVPLQQWISSQTVGDEMLWKGAFGHQVGFMRDRLNYLLASGLEAMPEDLATVISTHMSKSIRLPVVSFNRPDLGIRFVVRDNFYNWKLSVVDETRRIRRGAPDFTGLFKTRPPPEPDYTGDPLAYVYFEGFPGDLVFGYYDASDGSRWSAEISGNNEMWTTLFLCMRAVGAIRPRVFHTRASHQASLEERTKLDRVKMP